MEPHKNCVKKPGNHIYVNGETLLTTQELCSKNIFELSQFSIEQLQSLQY